MLTDHLSEETLHLYLDGELAPAEHEYVETHLSSCDECESRLESLRGLFETISAVPDRVLSQDLTPAVLAAIQPAAFPWTAGRWLAGLQIGVALILFFYSWPRLLARLALIPWDTWSAELAASSTSIASQITLIQASLLEVAQSILNQWTGLLEAGAGLNAPGASIWPWAAALGLLWLAINGLLLRPSRLGGDRG